MLSHPTWTTTQRTDPLAHPGHVHNETDPPNLYGQVQKVSVVYMICNKFKSLEWIVTVSNTRKLMLSKESFKTMKGSGVNSSTTSTN